MKKLLIILATFLLPLLAAAYELETEYSHTAKELTPILTQHINANYNNQTYQSSDGLYKKVLSILNKNKAVNHHFGISANDDGTTSNFACYIVDNIKRELEEEGLTEQLTADVHTLNEVANHIVSTGFDNKYETLLAIGVNPIEAGLRLGHNKGHKYGPYVDEALSKGQITYQHYDLQSSSKAIVTEQVLYITTTEEEIEAIQENLTKLNTLQRPEWMQELIKDFKQEIKQSTKKFFNYF